MSIEHLPATRRTWYENVPVPEGFTEPDAISWAATPLHPYSEHQKQVHEQIEYLFAHPYPADTPKEFSDLVAFDYMAGSAHRETVNYSHFMHWQTTYPEEVAGRADLIDRAQQSGNCPRELLDFVLTSSVQATELGKMTIPYGYRLEQLEAFRGEIVDSIIERNGELLDEQPYSRMHVSPHFTDDGSLRGLIATYQRHVGRVLDEKSELVTITERQALAIRVDEASGFPRDLYQSLSSTDEKKRVAALKTVEEEYVATDSAEKFMVPLSVVTFAHHEKVKKVEASIDTSKLRQHMAELVLKEKHSIK